MENSLFKKVKKAIDYWYIPLLVGLLFVGIGIWSFITPLAAYLTLAFIFSISFLGSGIFEIIFALSNRKKIDNWGWTLASGILGLVVGILLISNPLISITILPLYVGFVILFRSIMAIVIAFDLKSYAVPDWGNLLALGILGIIFSFILLWNPIFAGLSLVYWTAFAFIAIGVFYIYFSFKLKRIHDIPERLHDLEDKINS
ncbi:HdeD family acid-resistance protein [Flavobacterium sp. PL02]|uniref:HdeD family acid-resistance protein n=1 Tax=Flavobacterium sp. PL02 TaxID=3088354 RepID=UPI002B231638|nr:HdeD family acid-resistance protein [Flavobacterium sp. PL02]MEA9411820.1 HdeD family acid-resistance protein [Flavobacterium sp. PL02]